MAINTSIGRDNNWVPIQGAYEHGPVSGNATVTTAGTPVQLASVATPALRLDITANPGNTDVIVVGGSGVVGPLSGRKGVPLEPSATYTLTTSDLSLIWIDSAHNGDGVTYNYWY